MKGEINNNEEQSAYYDGLIKIINNTDTVSDKENPDWKLQELETMFLDACEQAGKEALLKNDGTIFMTLSGGVDSTLLLASLRERLGEDVKIVTFTMGGDEEHEDVKYARQASELFHTEHREFIPQPGDIQNALEEYKLKNPDKNLKEATRWGDIDVYLLYKFISESRPNILLVSEAIDEQMGGYWEHRKDMQKDKRKTVFNVMWHKMTNEHIKPLIKTSGSFNINLILPYLNKDLVSYISQIPVEDRVKDGIGKYPLKEVARRIGVPDEIVDRPKRGAVGMTEIEERRKQSHKHQGAYRDNNI